MTTTIITTTVRNAYNDGCDDLGPVDIIFARGSHQVRDLWVELALLLAPVAYLNRVGTTSVKHSYPPGTEQHLATVTKAMAMCFFLRQELSF